MLRLPLHFPQTGVTTMSAFIVEDDLIDLLVTYATSDRGPGQRQLIAAQSPQSLGAMLVAQNWRSVGERYRESGEPAPYTFTPYTGPMESMAVIKACNCYDYQACETEDYETTEPARIVRDIRDTATREIIRKLPAYDKAPWGAAPNPQRRGNKCGTPVRLSAIPMRNMRDFDKL